MKDSDFQIRFFEELIKKKPDFAEALAALGDLYTKQGWHEKGLKVDQKLALLKPEDPIVLYNLACSYSLVNNIDQAFETIQNAVDCGYDNLEHLTMDRDLINLRGDQRFQRYFENIKKEKTFN